MLLNVEYVKTCKSCGDVFKSDTGSGYCAVECFETMNAKSIAMPSSATCSSRLTSDGFGGSDRGKSRFAFAEHSVR